MSVDRLFIPARHLRAESKHFVVFVEGVKSDSDVKPKATGLKFVYLHGHEVGKDHLFVVSFLV